MSHRPASSELTEDSEQAELTRLLVDGLVPIAPPPGQHERLQARLMDRIASSVADHKDLVTVRRNDRAWRSIKAGVRIKPLWTGPEGSSILIEFVAGASLPVHRHRWVEEGMVLQGGLQMGKLELGPLDYHVSLPGSRHECIGSRQGAIAYLRGTALGHKPSVVMELLGGLLPYGGDPARTVFTNDREGWVEVAAGVMKKELWSDGTRSSRYYRLEAGARVPGHRHRLEEECMMLEGEVFLGDILLRAGDYQLAPRGSRHGEIYSDVGATLFVRGARDD